MNMIKTLTSAATLVLVATAVSAMDRQEIDALPKDKVAVIKQHCAEEWPDNFGVRVFCEDT
jgi:hypothetical protein